MIRDLILLAAIASLLLLWIVLLLWYFAPILKYQDERDVALDDFGRDQDWPKLIAVLDRDPRLEGGSREW